MPNEDAQSLVFEASSLFDVDKFSGFDRVEGGTRANLGMRYTFMAGGGASVTALAGQSIHLAGTNSFGSPGIAELVAMNFRPLTGYGSGLDTRQSDYVSSILIDSGRGLRLGASARLDNRDLTINRAEVQATGLAGPVTASITYAYLKTPSILYQLITPNNASLIEDERAEIQSSVNFRVTENWRLFGGVRYDMRNDFVVNNLLGLGFDNDSFSASLSYSEDTDRGKTKDNDGARVLTDRVVYFRFGLRTVGDGSISNNLMR
jgi:LPS-assembly protein